MTPGVLFEDMACDPWCVVSGHGLGPTVLFQDMAWDPCSLCQDMAWDPCSLCQDMAWDPRCVVSGPGP